MCLDPSSLAPHTHTHALCVGSHHKLVTRGTHDVCLTVTILYMYILAFL